jgi:hypothetical protein
MEDGQFVIAGQLDIEFRPVKAGFGRGSKSKNRVFGPQFGSAAVGDIEQFAHFS